MYALDTSGGARAEVAQMIVRNKPLMSQALQMGERLELIPYYDWLILEYVMQLETVFIEFLMQNLTFYSFNLCSRSSQAQNYLLRKQISASRDYVAYLLGESLKESGVPQESVLAMQNTLSGLIAFRLDSNFNGQKRAPQRDARNNLGGPRTVGTAGSFGASYITYGDLGLPADEEGTAVAHPRKGDYFRTPALERKMKAAKPGQPGTHFDRAAYMSFMASQVMLNSVLPNTAFSRPSFFLLKFI